MFGLRTSFFKKTLSFISEEPLDFKKEFFWDGRTFFLFIISFSSMIFFFLFNFLVTNSTFFYFDMLIGQNYVYIYLNMFFIIVLGNILGLICFFEKHDDVIHEMNFKLNRRNIRNYRPNLIRDIIEEHLDIIPNN